jgi:hypothetical protein
MGMQESDGYAQRLADRRTETRYDGGLPATFTYTPRQGGVRVVTCEVSSVSASGMVIVSELHGEPGEHIWVDLEGFGLVRCEVERLREDGFVCTNLIRDDARKRLGAWVSLLRRRGGRKEGDHRRHMRARPRDTRTTLTFTDGTVIDAKLMDVSRAGAAVYSDHFVDVGEPISVGRVPAHVARIFEGGFAVAFEIVLEAADADRLVAGYEVYIPPTKKAI